MLLIGGRCEWLGRSQWLETICGREEGAPPPVDLAAEQRNGEFILSLIRAGRVTAVHDISDGGLAVALAEMAIAGGVGATIEHMRRRGAWLPLRRGPRPLCHHGPAERSGRAPHLRRGRACRRLSGSATTGGDALTLPGEPPILIADLAAASESWFPAYMAGPQREFP